MNGPSRRAHETVLAWVSMLGTDLLLHAGILARAYDGPSPFLLDPVRAFSRIPLGYLALLVLSALLTQLALRLEIRTWRRGLAFGAGLGATIWGALVLGLASISTAPWRLLAAWFVGQTVELGIAGAVVGASLGGARSRRLWALVLGWCGVAFVLTVLLQNLGRATASAVR